MKLVGWRMLVNSEWGDIWTWVSTKAAQSYPKTLVPSTGNFSFSLWPLCEEVWPRIRIRGRCHSSSLWVFGYGESIWLKVVRAWQAAVHGVRHDLATKQKLFKWWRDLHRIKAQYSKRVAMGLAEIAINHQNLALPLLVSTDCWGWA